MAAPRRAWQAGNTARHRRTGWKGTAHAAVAGPGRGAGRWGRSVVTIGVFDGVHRGHQRIVQRAAGLAAGLGLPVAVVTFDPHPDEVVRPGTHPPFLATARRRAELLAGLGVDAVLLLPFTLEFSRLGPDEFVQAVLVDRLHAARVVVGENFRFGHRAAGDVALLGELGEKYDFTAEGVTLLADEGATISSSGIRQRLAAGDVAAAARDLGRPHRVDGVVVRGQHRGRALGFPTANLDTLPHTAIPADGVYAGWLASLGADGREQEHWPAAISIGTNPTFDGESAPSRRTRWIVTTSTCTARGSRSTSPTGCAAPSGSIRCPTWSRRCTGTWPRSAPGFPAASGGAPGAAGRGGPASPGRAIQAELRANLALGRLSGLVSCALRRLAKRRRPQATARRLLPRQVRYAIRRSVLYRVLHERNQRAAYHHGEERDHRRARDQ